MVKIKLACIILLLIGCKQKNNATPEHQVQIGSWRYKLLLQDNNSSRGILDSIIYVKASLQIGNTKTQRSLLYSASANQTEYQNNYKYLSFYADSDLYLKCGDSIIYPIGYVFEPSNGLLPDERLVYKFALTKQQHFDLTQKDAVFWYHDRIAKLGKICLR